MANANAKRTYALEVKTDTWAGSTEVFVSVYAHEAGSKHPLNPRGEGEHEIWDAPKKVHGLLLCDLHIKTYTPAYKAEDGTLTYEDVQTNVQYGTHYNVDLVQANKMVKTLTKVQKQIIKDRALEPGDVLVSFAKAIGATECVIQVGGSRNWLPEGQWEFHPLEMARDAFRLQIRQNIEKLLKEKHNGK